MGTISLEHSNRLFWLGRYIERVFTTIKTIEKYVDKTLDQRPEYYKKYLNALGLDDNWGSIDNFTNSFFFDENNNNSVAYSLNCAYDNGIVLREDISTESLSYIQLAQDKLVKIKDSNMPLRYELIDLLDTLYAFWGCIEDYIYDEELENIIKIGRHVERLDLYMRFNYSSSKVSVEFDRLCKSLRYAPKNSPFRYNTQHLSVLCEVVGMDDYINRLYEGLDSLAKLFS